MKVAVCKFRVLHCIKFSKPDYSEHVGLALAANHEVKRKAGLTFKKSFAFAFLKTKLIFFTAKMQRAQSWPILLCVLSALCG